MSDAAFTRVGRVMRTHGLNGEVSVSPEAGTSFESLLGATVWIVPPGTVRTASIAAIRPGPKGPLVSLEGVDSIDLAQGLTGRDILVETSLLPAEYAPAVEGRDMTGYRVNDARHGDLGLIEETIVTGANDVWVVHGPFGEVLIPVIEQVVVEIDDDACTVRVELLEGLLPGGPS